MSIIIVHNSDNYKTVMMMTKIMPIIMLREIAHAYSTSNVGIDG